MKCLSLQRCKSPQPPKATTVFHTVRAMPCSLLFTKLTRGPAGYEETYRKNKLPRTHT